MVQIEHQEEVNLYFQQAATFWKEIYTRNDAYARIHQLRHQRVLEWIEQLGLETGSQVLEIGCGAGFLSLALAERTFNVHAIDSVDAMVEQTRQHVREARMTEQISVDVGDITSLVFQDGSFDLVLAIGVIPWIERPDTAIQEMARVLKPGGRVILTADNRARLNIWLDPLRNPLLLPLKRLVKFLLHHSKLRRFSVDDVGSHFHSSRFIDKNLASSKLVKVKSVTLGFGPFTLFNRSILSASSGLRLHRRLQRLAERGTPVFRSTGAQYIVLAQKTAFRTFEENTATQKSTSGAASVQ
jgi:ubiquinone/menaquinone biosynthesis C-methylase UbiE